MGAGRLFSTDLVVMVHKEGWEAGGKAAPSEEGLGQRLACQGQAGPEVVLLERPGGATSSLWSRPVRWPWAGPTGGAVTVIPICK